MTPIGPFFLGLWLLCAVGAVVLATTAAPAAILASTLTAGFLVARLASLTTFGPNLDPSWLSAAAALAALAVLLRPIARTATIPALFVGGALAAFWGRLLYAQAVPSGLADACAGGLVALAAVLATRRPAFAPTYLKEEALVILLVLSLGVAAAPGIVAGWTAAQTLNAEAGGAAAAAVPMWALGLAIGASALGGIYSWWTHR